MFIGNQREQLQKEPAHTDSRGIHGHSLLTALSHRDVKVGDRSVEEMRGACCSGSSPPFLGRERAAVDVGRSLRYHESDLRVKT